MREPQLVPVAIHAPCACLCTNTTGPFLDTFFDLPVGRWYVCKRCAKTHARLFGFSTGKRLDELENVQGLVEGKDAEIAKLHVAIEELRIENGSERRAGKQLAEELQLVRGVLKTSRHMAAAMEQSAHELVEAVAPVAQPQVAEVVAA